MNDKWHVWERSHAAKPFAPQNRHGAHLERVIHPVRGQKLNSGADGRGDQRRSDPGPLVGAPAKPLGVAAFSLIGRRRSLSGSMIGGIPETQEMLDFCGAHNITADVEVIPIQKVNEAYERLLKSDVKYRFSIDMASLKGE